MKKFLFALAIFLAAILFVQLTNTQIKPYPASHQIRLLIAGTRYVITATILLTTIYLSTLIWIILSYVPVFKTTTRIAPLIFNIVSSFLLINMLRTESKNIAILIIFPTTLVFLILIKTLFQILSTNRKT